MNALEFRPWGARVDRPDAPDRLVFDLDPAPDVPWPAVVAAARDIHARLRRFGLRSFVRTSGGKGLHVMLPILRGPDWVAAKHFCEALAGAMVVRRPRQYIATGQVAAARPDLHRLAAQHARRHQRVQLAACPRRRAGGDAAALGGTGAGAGWGGVRPAQGAEADGGLAARPVGGHRHVAAGAARALRSTRPGPPPQAGEGAKPGFYFTCSVLFARCASGSGCFGGSCCGSGRPVHEKDALGRSWRSPA